MWGFLNDDFTMSRDAAWRARRILRCRMDERWTIVLSRAMLVALNKWITDGAPARKD
jgi:hypothetical protein